MTNDGIEVIHCYTRTHTLIYYQGLTGSLIELRVWRPWPINVTLSYHPIDNIWDMMFV